MKISLILVLLLLVGCSVDNTEVMETDSVAYLAGGCFWCTEAAFEELDGVGEVVSGYAGGTLEDPTYAQVVSGTTTHRESVRIHYDSSVVSYAELLDFYWQQIDPTDAEGQFVDKGFQYTTAIFYLNPQEMKIALNSKNEFANLSMFSKPIVTEVIAFTNFYEAEEYHQDYYLKRSFQYKAYESGSGRKEFRQKFWS